MLCRWEAYVYKELKGKETSLEIKIKKWPQVWGNSKKL